MVGKVFSVAGTSARLTLSVVVLLFAASGVAAAPAESYVVEGACREGVVQGRYEVRTADGALRVAGAFNHGRRTGSFIFWNKAGARVAHIPYDDDRRNGTLADWYRSDRSGDEPARRFEMSWRRGVQVGAARTWYRDGRLRSEAVFDEGRAVAAKGWSASGEPLQARAALELAERDARAANDLNAALELMVSAHLPRCD